MKINLNMFDVLHVLIGSLKASSSVLIWSLIVVILIVMTFALVLNFAVEDYILDESNPLSGRKEMFELFGSFSRSFVTVFQVDSNGSSVVILICCVRLYFGVISFLF